MKWHVFMAHSVRVVTYHAALVYLTSQSYFLKLDMLIFDDKISINTCGNTKDFLPEEC